MPGKVKGFANQGFLNEAHLIEISKLQIDLQFSDWLTTEEDRMVYYRLKMNELPDTVKIFCTQELLDETHLRKILGIELEYKLNRLPDEIKNFVTQGLLEEAHLREISLLLPGSQFLPWLTTEEDIVRLAEEDNENDEYHRPVNPVDEWAHYAWLSDQGWTQERIAKAKNTSRSKASERISLHNMPDKVKLCVHQGLLEETHIMQLLGVSIDGHFSDWLTTEQAQLEIAQEAAKRSLTVRKTKHLVDKWQDVIQGSINKAHLRQISRLSRNVALALASSPTSPSFLRAL